MTISSYLIIINVLGFGPLHVVSDTILKWSSLRTDTQYPITFFIAFHSIGYQISLLCYSTISSFRKNLLDIIKPIVKCKHLLDCLKQMKFKDQEVLSNKGNLDLVSELIPKLRFHYISLHWVSDYLPLSLNQERF